MATESIIKDSFYKERLLQTTLHNQSQSIDLDNHKVIPEEVIGRSLQNFGKTSAGSGYAYLSFKCNYQSLESLSSLAPYVNLEHIDVSNNNIRSLKVLSNFRYLVSLDASHNNLARLDVKHAPYSLDTVDCSFNQITQIPNLSQHRFLRKFSLRNNKISKIQGLSNNKNLRILDLSENEIEDVQGLDGLNLTELYLSANKIQFVKGFTKLEKLRVLDLSINQIGMIDGLSQLISLRTLLLSKNRIRHVRQMGFLQNLAFLSELDLCYNPVQERRYYRLQVAYRLPMLKVLDGTEVTAQEVVKAENLYGMDVDERSNIFKSILPEEEFIDQRIHVSELIEAESDNAGEQANFIDKYEEDGTLKSELGRSKRSRSKGSSHDKSYSASKRSAQSKMSKLSSIN